MRSSHALFAGLFLGSCITGRINATEYKLGATQIDNPWSRATPKGATTGAGYMTIKSTGTEADRLGFRNGGVRP
jgi:copper(I)-binding protein